MFLSIPSRSVGPPFHISMLSILLSSCLWSVHLVPVSVVPPYLCHNVLIGVLVGNHIDGFHCWEMSFIYTVWSHSSRGRLYFELDML